MALLGVPWAIGNGANVTDDVARVFANVAVQDSEGINLPGDLKVTAMPAPAGQVSVAPGAVAIRNRHLATLDGSGRVLSSPQTYVGAGATATTLNVPAQGSSGDAYYLVLLTVRDPDFPPWTEYTDPTQRLNGPYFYLELKPCDSDDTLASDVVTYSAYALARIRMNANTTVVEENDLTDLRELARPRTKPDKDQQRGVVANNGNGLPQGEQMLPTHTDWRFWPTNQRMSKVPLWAVTATVRVDLLNVPVDGPVDVNTRVRFGPLIGTDVGFFDYNGAPQTANGFVETRSHSTIGRFDVRALRGTTVGVRLEAKRTYAPVNPRDGHIWFTSSEQWTVTIDYDEVRT